ncbi:hypothetical protein [Micromonospora sp. WMMD980]|uniref:hypothetical protein n=1 Tax=Micromonospora sp. WMMD980 TaxID=3016088 RepID=UPI00241781E2|nr:hypothetical protein [Micromonospora sp. WMMD980]MDG4801754.1 hypothetical protein [Micromonospora sp. WMMD980]
MTTTYYAATAHQRLMFRAVDAIYDGLEAGEGLRTVTARVAVDLANEAIAAGATRAEGLEIGREVCAVALDIQRDLMARRPASAA